MLPHSWSLMRSMAKPKTYMLWQFNPKEDMEEEIKIAIRYFIEKYGKTPEILEYSNSIEPIKTKQIETKAVNLGPINFLIGYA